VIAAGGRTLLLRAHSAAIAAGRNDIIFVTDCDYEVTLGTLRGASTLVITKHADVESDLVDLGCLRDVISEVVPAALDSDERLDEISRNVLERSVALVEPIGRMRKIARERGFSIYTDVRFSRVRRPHGSEVDIDKVVRTVVQNSGECPISVPEFEKLLVEQPGGFEVCNGHDLIRAASQVLRDDYGVRDQTPDSLARLLRHGVKEKTFRAWSVTQRIKRWEDLSNRQVLAC
jgi:hypothetical protein